MSALTCVGRQRAGGECQRRCRRLPALEQEIFQLLHWQGYREAELENLLRRSDGSTYAPEMIREALRRLAGVIFRQGDGAIREVPISVERDGEEKQMDLPDATYVPENQLLAAEQQDAVERYVSVLKEALANLPAESALYIRLRFYSNPPKAPKEIARLMNRSERDIYRIRQEVMLLLKTTFKSHGLEKIQDLSV